MGKIIFFFDAMTSIEGRSGLRITQSHFDKDTCIRHSVYIPKEDLDLFTTALSKVLLFFRYHDENEEYQAKTIRTTKEILDTQFTIALSVLVSEDCSYAEIANILQRDEEFIRNACKMLNLKISSD